MTPFLDYTILQRYSNDVLIKPKLCIEKKMSSTYNAPINVFPRGWEWRDRMGIELLELNNFEKLGFNLPPVILAKYLPDVDL